MKPRRLGAQRLKALTVGGEQRRNGRRHLILTAASTPVVEAAAAALASLSDEPIFAKSPAAAAIISGTAITYDMSITPISSSGRPGRDRSAARHR